MYQDYRRQFRKWERDNAAPTGQRSPHPLMIAVVNNRRNAQKLHESLGGAARDADGDGVRYDPPTGFDLLSNVPHLGATAARSPPNVSRSRNSTSRREPRSRAGRRALDTLCSTLGLSAAAV